MAITVSLRQVGSVLEVTWTTDQADPIAGFDINRTINPPDTAVKVGNTAGDNRLFVDSIATGEVTPGDTLEYEVEDADTLTAGTAQIEWQDPAADRWTTIDRVRTVLGPLEASYTDDQIDTAIVQATARLESVMCKTVAVDDTTGLPTDTNIIEATSIMAARIVVAPTLGVPEVQGGALTSERLGSYGYTLRPGTGPTSSSPFTIDAVIKELAGGYLCPGIAGIPFQTDTWPYASADEDAFSNVSVT